MGIWRFAGAFAVVKRQSELQISEANAGAEQIPDYTKNRHESVFHFDV